MDICSEYNYGEIKAFRLGKGIVGQPKMCAYFYIIKGVIIDTGPSNMSRYFDRITEDKKIDLGLLTHHHEDHSGNAALLIKKRGIPLYANTIAAEKLKQGFKIMPYQHIFWGKAQKADIKPLKDIIEFGPYRFEAIHTPGHSKDHTVFYEKNKGWLLSGDLYLGNRIKYFRSDEKIDHTIKSLKKMLQLDFDMLLCAHNPQIHRGKDSIRKKLDYLENIYGEVSHQYKKGKTAKEIMKILPCTEDKFVKFITYGNVSFLNIIRSAIEAIEKKAT